MGYSQMKQKFFRIFFYLAGIFMLCACQATDCILDKTDKYVAKSVSELSDKEVCTSLKMNYGPITKDALREVSKSKNLNCNKILEDKKTNETREQREKRIDEAIRLFNNAAEISVHNNQSPAINNGLMCQLTGQSRSGLFKNCSYSCGSGIFYKTINSSEICPLSATR